MVLAILKQFPYPTHACQFNRNIQTLFSFGSKEETILVLSLQFLEALKSLMGYFLRILHDIPYHPCFYALWSQVFSLRSLITTAEFCHVPLCSSYLSFVHLFSHLSHLHVVTPRPCRHGVKHKGEAVAADIAVVSPRPLAKGLACR